MSLNVVLDFQNHPIVWQFGCCYTHIMFSVSYNILYIKHTLCNMDAYLNCQYSAHSISLLSCCCTAHLQTLLHPMLMLMLLFI